MDRSEVRQMLRTIERESEFAARFTGRPKLSRRVLQALADVPREQFVPPEMVPYAYADNALPIGEGQTISQPFIVALMTDLLQTEKTDIILEVGTGSGYQAAVLSRLVDKVYSLEIIPELAEQTSQLLNRLGFTNVEVLCADGYGGLPDKAPFDGIIVTAAAPDIPLPLKEQLKPSGHLVIPVGLPYSHQELMVCDKDPHGHTHTREILGVAFVPMTGKRTGR